MQNSQRVHDAKPRTAPMARRRDGDIAPYRNGTAPRGTGGAHAKPHERCARQRGTGGAHATGPHHGVREVRTRFGAVTPRHRLPGRPA